MAADKFDCPKCGGHTLITATVVGKRETSRYRYCRICEMSFATAEAIKDTPKMRRWLGEAKASELWPKPPFKYRTIAQQNRATKPKP